jgi:hypothetical protein
MRTLTALTVLGLASAAFAQGAPYYVRGDLNGWGGTDYELTDMGGGHFATTITGLTPNQKSEFKVTTDDWSYNGPASNAVFEADANGEVTIHFYEDPAWTDGWMPDTGPRVGWEWTLPGTEWEIMGSFNGWSDPVMTLSDMGNSFFEGSMIVPTAGTYEFKIRKQGDWDINVGADFGKGANIFYTTTTDNEEMIVSLDLVGGRYQVIPTPASIALLGLGGLVATRRRR